jgi:GNAT superfamily N-acetyltransferase
MTVDLDRARLESSNDEQRLAQGGVFVRRLRPDDEPRFTEWVRTFGGTWHAEAAGALRRDPVGCHIAVRGEGSESEYVGFACHGVNRRAWFGPMGTAESMRGQGVGAVLLRRCLSDQRDAGLRHAEIGWTGPIRFYSRAVGAILDRVFWTYQKES